MKGRNYALVLAKRTTGISLLCVIMLDTNELYNAVTGEPVALDMLAHSDLNPLHKYAATITGTPMSRLGSSEYYKPKIK